MWVHKGNACGVRRPFAGATFWGDIYGIFKYFVGIGLSTRSEGERSNTLFGAACQKQMLYGGLPFRKNWRFFAYFVSDL